MRERKAQSERERKGQSEREKETDKRDKGTQGKKSVRVCVCVRVLENVIGPNHRFRRCRSG